MKRGWIPLDIRLLSLELAFSESRRNGGHTAVRCVRAWILICAPAVRFRLSEAPKYLLAHRNVLITSGRYTYHEADLCTPS